MTPAMNTVLIRPLLLALVLVPSLAFPSPAVGAMRQDASLDTVEARTREARRRFERMLKAGESALVPKLWELAQWCRKHRLYLEEDRLARMILRVDEGHRGARRTLKFYPRGRGWHQADTYHLPRNFASEPALEEYRQRLTRLIEPFKLELFTALEREGRFLKPEQRHEPLRMLLLVQPDDALLHGLLGERRLGERWVLEETVRAAERRRGIRALARASLAGVPVPQPLQPDSDELAMGLTWQAALRTQGVRVLGTTPPDEVGRTARVSEAVAGLFRSVFGVARGHRAGYTIYLLSDPGERNVLLGHLQGVDASTRALLEQAAGGWLGSPVRLGEWDANPARRLDGAARQTLGTLLMDAYGIDADQGWIWEGVGLYLARYLTGTRLTYFFGRNGYSAARQTTLWPRLQAPDADWLAIAAEVLAAENAPDLVFLLGRDVNAMGDEDLLVSYAFAAYLLEGRPADAPRILGRIGAGEHPVTVLEAVTRESLPQLQHRLQRWLDEIRTL